MRRSHLFAAILLAASSLAVAQSIPDVRTAGAVLLLSEEPPAKIAVDPPLAGPLSRGRVVIPYRTRNIRLLANFGPAAAAVSPRIGHLHVTLDDAPWVWMDASGEPVTLNGLQPGPHKLRLELESANHQKLDEGIVTFTIPPRSTGVPAAAVPSLAGRPAARLVIDAPLTSAAARSSSTASRPGDTPLRLRW
jgi:hypothetical protein